MPDPRKYASAKRKYDSVKPEWVKRAGRRRLTPAEAKKVEAKKVDAFMAARRVKPKPKPKSKPKSGWQRLLDALNPERKKE